MSLLIEHWSYDPFLLVAGFVVLWHGVGLRRLIRRSRPERLPDLRRRALRFYAGIAILLLTVESPVDYWAHDYYFIHMIQHVLLMFLAPAAIVAGAPWQPLLLGVPLAWRRRSLPSMLHGGWARPFRALGRGLMRPWVAVCAFNAVMLVWQLPVLFNLAEKNGTVHIWLMHGSMFAIGIVFWLQLIPSPPVKNRMTLAGQVGALVGTSIVMWVLAMAMSLFSQHSWYSSYSHIPGVTLAPFADQQLAGGILWVCGDLWAVPALIGVFKRLINEEGSVDAAIDNILRPRAVGRPRWPSSSPWSRW